MAEESRKFPPGTDLSGLKSAVIWCRRFVVGFGVAPLSPELSQRLSRALQPMRSTLPAG